MQFITINHHRTGAVLFEGRFPCLRTCLETAVAENADLAFAGLARTRLIAANLDGARLRYARLNGANLMGANLSDADLTGADFGNASLQNTCFCYSRLQGCNFEGALFGATDISGADISRSRFSTLSGLSINFIDSGAMDGCCYAHTDGRRYPFSRPPVSVSGLPKPVIFMDSHFRIGAEIRPYGEAAHAFGTLLHHMKALAT